MPSILVAVWSYEFERLAHVEITDLDTKDEPLVVKTSSRDAEGWNEVEDRYWMEDGVVHASHHSDGVDCDGRLEWWSTSEWSEAEGAWVGGDTGQRDHAAEAAGY